MLLAAYEQIEKLEKEIKRLKANEVTYSWALGEIAERFPHIIGELVHLECKVNAALAEIEARHDEYDSK